MKKEEFLGELRSRLSGLPGEAIEERVQCYGELVDHRMETGLTEEEAVAGIGSINETVGQIMSEIPLTQLVKRRVDPKEKHSTGKIVALILLFPIWFPLFITFFSVFVSLYITAWVLWAAFFFVAVAFVVAAVGSVLAAVGYAIAGRPMGGIFMIGLALILAGVSLIIFLLDVGILKGMVALTKKLALGIKRIFVKTE